MLVLQLLTNLQGLPSLKLTELAPENPLISVEISELPGGRKMDI